MTAFATGAFWAVAAVVAARTVGPAASSRAMGIVLGGGMLATVLGVPLGAFGGQLIGWRGPFWALVLLALLLAVAVARTVPHDTVHQASGSIRAEFAGLKSKRLWLTLATSGRGERRSAVDLELHRALADRSDRARGMVDPDRAAVVRRRCAGRVGPRRTPWGQPSVRHAIDDSSPTVVAAVGLCVLSTSLLPTLALFTLLGLVGLSANPVLVHLAVHYGGERPTLASAMATSLFNFGTAVGTWINGLALASGLGALAPQSSASFSLSWSSSRSAYSPPSSVEHD